VADPLPIDHFESDVEALIRSAGSLPQVSTDLRPRVVEAAIAARQRRWRRRRAGLVAGIVLAFVAVPHPAANGPDPSSMVGQTQREATPVDRAENTDPLLASTTGRWRGVDAGTEWALVDSFTRLREDHLRMLRQAF
jgi:hypothetical protein